MRLTLCLKKQSNVLSKYTKNPGDYSLGSFFVLLKIKHIKKEAKSNKKKGSKKIMDLKINKAKTTVAPGQNLTNFEAIANKCLKQIKNKLYFQYKALSPVIYRMPIQFTEPGAGAFGTDAIRIYADPMDVILRYKKSQDELSRAYLHMLFHCIYLHPFQPVKNIDTGVWNIAMDICSEAAVQRLNPKQIAGDNDRSRIINDIKSRIKMFIPALVYKELMDNSMNYDFEELISLFHMDDHYWLEDQTDNQTVTVTAMVMVMATVMANDNGDGDGECDGDGDATATAMETVTVVATVTAMGIMMDQKAATAPSTRTVRFSRNSRNGRMLQDRLLQTCRISTTREKMPEISQQKLTS